MSARSIPWKIVVPSLVLAALLIFAEYTWLREHQQAKRIARANQLVEDKIATARGYLREQHWNEAIRELGCALEVEGATNGDTVHPLLEEARRGQAEALLDAAGIALSYGRLEDAQRLLRAYLAHPQAVRLDQARLLRDDLERALSDEEAARLLARLSDEALRIFADKGQLTVDDGLHTEAARFFFQETLRRNMAKETRRREAQREVARLTAERQAAEHARRIARLRATPAFHSLSSFLSRTREQLRDQQQLASRQEAELRVLFQQFGVKDPAEQEQIRADLLDRRTPADLREQIERKRTEVKRAYRNEPQFNRADGKLFDQLVDQEVDKFLIRAVDSPG
jgi:hypothetical protein